jgi:diguanylate cyclase (GGDEF)-like protein
MQPEQKSIHILLIDKNETDYLILRDYLSHNTDQEKYELDWAQTYQAGLLQLQSARQDIYLISQNLGTLSGLDLLQLAIQSGYQVPMILLTEQTDQEIIQAAMLAGAMDYLPISQLNTQVLERSIRYALERNRLLNKLRELSVRDTLTGLYNRHELHRFLDYELIKSKRYNHSLSIVKMDIDHFADITHRFGHRIADDILQQVAQALLNNIRGCDLAVRDADDDFIILLPETSASQATFPAERIRKVVEALSVQVSDETGVTEKISTTLSMGVAEYPADASTDQALIDLADQARNQAKSLGSNRVVHYTAQQA